jgi:hypothetical protein
MADNDGSGVDERARFWRNLVRVMAMQVVSLVLLWLLQRHYTA